MMIEDHDKRALAFEYVMGTLSKEMRAAVETAMQTDPVVESEVRFWEEQMLPDPNAFPQLAPDPQTFQKISQDIHDCQTDTRDEVVTPLWQKIFRWQRVYSGAFALLLIMFGLTWIERLSPTQALAPNTDYVAVLVDQNDEPILTALTASDGQSLWLKWEAWQAPKGHSLQLWSKSRRDGEIRPLMVFEGQEQKYVVLDQATLRLIQDSSHLIMTREEQGGSATDMPSEQVVAKGVCIRLAPAQSKV